VGTKRSHKEHVDILHVSRAEVKNRWGYRSTQPTSLRDVERDIFSLLFNARKNFELNASNRYNSKVYSCSDGGFSALEVAPD